MDKRIGVLGAMPEEIEGVISLLKDKKTVVKGMRKYHLGLINDVEVVVVFSRWGKVASATTVTHLIVEFGITELIFTGVAGAINPNLNIGDIVIASSLVQHDLDARPIMSQFEIPLIGKTELCPEVNTVNEVFSKVSDLINNKVLINLLFEDVKEFFSLHRQKAVVGQIASGDQFFSSNEKKELLLKQLPEVLCVEMEGAAVAQVCFEYNIPFVIVRIISDSANDNSVIDFNEFVTKVASKFGLAIVLKLLK
ncbi:5'-methylthioadenosine/adenosylhomocysteine nucleosidase [Flavobacterium adhaerens]|uniref:5'-methylthioadenosine/adenosylhomocysteine nucleosidase n=1 Tax=Flavobacterium adhaerens TaxID=3149043 RepID=UPI0032B3F9E1